MQRLSFRLGRATRHLAHAVGGLGRATRHLAYAVGGLGRATRHLAQATGGLGPATPHLAPATPDIDLVSNRASSTVWPTSIVAGTVFALLAGLLIASAGVPARAGSGLPPVPASWPASRFELGLMSQPGDAGTLRASAPLRFRYQYLAGGVNTGAGWATWNPDGSFVSSYIQDSVAHSMVPVFPYYMLLQSKPAVSSNEATQDLAHLDDATVMTAYWADLRHFFERAAGSSPVVLHVEPDLWGYIEQAAANDDAATVPAKVGSLGIATLAGLPDTAAGFAQGIVRLRNSIAPNVVLAYHLSDWGTKTDLHLAQTTDAQTDALAARAGRFYDSLAAAFDVAFTDIADRDSAFKQAQYGDGGASWWSSADFPRFARFFAGFTAVTGKRTVVWQIPLGNTRMRAMNDTWGHYQDNRVQWFLDDPSGTHLAMYRDAGVIALLFGGGASGTTCACDADGDGVTNPPPINGNDGFSLSADDDGGFFRSKAAAYYRAGALPLVEGAGTAASPAGSIEPTATATSRPTATATAPAATALPAPTRWTIAATVRPAKATVGSATRVTTTVIVKPNRVARVLVDIELYDPTGRKAQQAWFDSQAFRAGVARVYAMAWPAPSGPTGKWTVKIGVFTTGWGPLLKWNNRAATFVLTR